jgi:hypothetical protein
VIWSSCTVTGKRLETLISVLGIDLKMYCLGRFLSALDSRAPRRMISNEDPRTQLPIAAGFRFVLLCSRLLGLLAGCFAQLLCCQRRVKRTLRDAALFLL